MFGVWSVVFGFWRSAFGGVVVVFLSQLLLEDAVVLRVAIVLGVVVGVARRHLKSVGGWERGLVSSASLRRSRTSEAART